MTDHDPVNHPAHYTSHPSGVECIDITEHMGFNLGNALKYLWRADLKGDAITDLEKAAWYVQREIDRRRIAAEQAVERGIKQAADLTSKIAPFYGLDSALERCPFTAPNAPDIRCALDVGHDSPHRDTLVRGPYTVQWRGVHDR